MRRVEEWRGLVQRNTPIARQVLDRRQADRIAWTPHLDDAIYEYSGRLQFDRLLAGIVRTENRRKRQRPLIGIVTEGGTSPSRRAPFRNLWSSVGIDFTGTLQVA